MEAFWTTAVLGTLLLLMGIANRMGDLRSLHRYHRRRVAEADLPAMGKAVGLGTILCGVACLFYACFHLLAEWTAWHVLLWIGIGGLLLGMSLGLVLMLRAILKYNKGLF